MNLANILILIRSLLLLLARETLVFILKKWPTTRCILYDELLNNYSLYLYLLIFMGNLTRTVFPQKDSNNYNHFDNETVEMLKIKYMNRRNPFWFIMTLYDTQFIIFLKLKPFF